MKIKDTLLLVGESKSRSELRNIFNSTYNILEAESKEQALFLLEQNIHCIAAVLVDIIVPKRRQDSAIPKIKSTAPNIPLIVILENKHMLHEMAAYDLGADDVVMKPYNETGIFKRAQTIIELSIHKNNLEALVDEQAGIIRSSNEVLIDLLTSIIEYRSTETKHHAIRLRKLTKVLLEKVAELAPEYHLTTETINTVVSAVSLHDIGKVSIPDNILNKPAKLTKEEFEMIKKHTVNGADILKNLKGFGNQKYLKLAYNICLYHHERWDGGGYPFGLKGDEIPICAQVAGLVDVYDALTSPRVYKEAFSFTQAENMIFNGECGVFSPFLLECFNEVKEEFQQLSVSNSDEPDSGVYDITEPLPMPNSNLLQSDSLNIIQMKYQTLLHYMDCPIMEIDLSTGAYHIVFNPNPDFVFPGDMASFEEAMEEFTEAYVHQNDKAVSSGLADSLREVFKDRSLRKHNFNFRVFSKSNNRHIMYRLTAYLLRERLNNEADILMIWQTISDEEAYYNEEVSRDFDKNLKKHKYTILEGLINNPICYINDKNLTIVGGFDSISRILGYTPTEVQYLFNNSYLEMILPQDRDNVLSSINTHLKYGEKNIEFSHNLLHKNGDMVNIKNRSCLFEDANGVEHFCASLTDAAEQENISEQLKLDFEQSIIVLQHSDDIFFEIDLKKNKFYCSDKINKRFGYEPIKNNFTVDILKRSHIHPDDLVKIKDVIHILDSDETYIELELRICDSDGKYSWHKVRGTIVRGYDGKALKILGAIIDVDKGMQASFELKNKAERDSLTGLYNKEVSRSKIEAYLTDSESDALSALLMIDLDNFKNINDTYGHLFGDTVLTHTAAELRKYFRSDDIIGRVGGDEFLVFVKNITSTELIESRCKVLIEAIQNLFGVAYSDIGLSCSIGVALAPKHGKTFTNLYDKADQALYQAKASGKNCFSVYDENYDTSTMNLISAINTRIDSDEEPGISDNNLTYFLFRKLYESEDIYKGINDILAEVGKYMNVSRVYIFENNDSNTACSNTFEWCNEGIHPEIDNLQDLSYLEGLVMGYQDVFDERGLFYCPDINKLQSRFKQVLEPQNVKSLLQCAIHDKGVFRGFVGFDECINNRVWTIDQTEFLFFLSQILSIFLFNERNKERSEKNYTNLYSILDNLEQRIYVISKDYDLLFDNKKILNKTEDPYFGEKCYSVIKNRTKKCTDCPITKYLLEGITHPNSNVSVIKWNDSYAYMVSLK